MSESKNTSLEQNKQKKRSFHAIFKNPEGVVVMAGRYCGCKPGQAASKALTKIFRSFKSVLPKPDKIRFGIHETTRHNANSSSRSNKTFWYEGAPERLTSQVVISNNTTDGSSSKRVCNFKNKFHKINEKDCSDLFNYVVVKDDTPLVVNITERRKRVKLSKTPKQPKKLTKKSSKSSSVPKQKKSKKVAKSVDPPVVPTPSPVTPEAPKSKKSKTAVVPPTPPVVPPTPPVVPPTPPVVPPTPLAVTPSEPPKKSKKTSAPSSTPVVDLTKTTTEELPSKKKSKTKSV